MFTRSELPGIPDILSAMADSQHLRSTSEKPRNYLLFNELIILAWTVLADGRRAWILGGSGTGFLPYRRLRKKCAAGQLRRGISWAQTVPSRDRSATTGKL